ncbi:MAG: hypothetical protein G01um10148_955 [Parcubacteria group bacterium Gr01-1014_8]|nr:MAG: hypothetical protein G01um10148_955 [Parcubacteria group bacterium Gr01-1014_8]
MQKKFLAAGAVALVLIPVAVFAATFRTGEQPTIPSGTTINDDLYIAGGNVTHAGVVTGDLIAAGGSVLVSGDVRGDALVSGGNVTILGAVSDDVRAAGGNVVINGAVSSDVVAVGGQLTIAGPGIGGDVLAAGGTVRIDAPVVGDVLITGGDVFINAPIKGKVDIEADKVTIGSAAVIAGDLTYRAGKEATIEEGAQVKGTTTHTLRADIGRAAKKGIAAFVSAWLVMKLLMLLAGAYAFFYLFKKYTETIVRDSLSDPMSQLGRGLVSFIVWPVAGVILLATVVGMPLGIMALLGYGILLIFAHIMAPIAIGSLLYAWATKSAYQVTWQTILLGVVAYFVLGFVPIVGWIIRFAFMLLVLGAGLSLKWNLAKEWR